MAAVLARGDTVIENAAREPEVADLALCLVKMGAKIDGIGTSTLRVEGVDSLHGAEHTVLPDRIETGTYAMAAAITGGEVFLDGARADLLQEALQTSALDRRRDRGEPVGHQSCAQRRRLERRVGRDPALPRLPHRSAGPAHGAHVHGARAPRQVRETIFENRFMHVQELARLGARIELKGDTALVTGVNDLRGAQVMATDLRASVSLIIAGLAAQGETLIGRVYHLDRGFERIEEKLGQCGAHIERLSG